MRAAQGSLLCYTSVLLCSLLWFFMSVLFFSCPFCLCPHKTLKFKTHGVSSNFIKSTTSVSLFLLSTTRPRDVKGQQKCVTKLTTESCGILERRLMIVFGSMWQVFIYQEPRQRSQSKHVQPTTPKMQREV